MWQIINYIAWGACAVFVFLFALDVIKTERETKEDEDNE